MPCPQVNHVEGGQNARPPYGRITERADTFPKSPLGCLGDGAGIVPYGTFDNWPLIPCGRIWMCGVQIAMITEHGLLIVYHSVPKSSFGVIPERKIGKKINQGRNRNEKYQTKANGTSGIGKKALNDMLVRQTVCAAVWGCQCNAIFLKSPV